jgi:hypothetical protein
MRKRSLFIPIGVLCCALLGACAAQPAAPASSAARAPAGSRAAEALTVEAQEAAAGASLPGGQYTLLDTAAMTGGGNRRFSALLAGDKLVYHTRKGETLRLLRDLADGETTGAAVTSADGSAAVYGAAGRTVYACAADETPLFLCGDWLALGVGPGEDGYGASAFVSLSTGARRAGPAGLPATAGTADTAGAVPGGGFWAAALRTAGGQDVYFYSAEAEETAAADHAKLAGFAGQYAVLAADSAAGSPALRTLDPATGAPGPAVPADGSFYPAGYKDYNVLAAGGESTVLDAAGAEVAQFSGLCLFYSGHTALLCAETAAPARLNRTEYGESAADGLTLVLPDGSTEAVRAAAWNTRSGSLAVQQPGGITVFGPDGSAHYTMTDALPAGSTFSLLASNVLAVTGTPRAPFTALYSGSGLLWRSETYQGFVLYDGSCIPAVYDAAGGRALILQGGRTVVGALDACRPLSDTRAAVQQGGAVGLVDAGGRWLWTLE